MHPIKATLTIILGMSALGVSAQQECSDSLEISPACTHACIDTLKEKCCLTTDKYLATLDSLRHAYMEWKYQGGDTLANPYLFQLLSPGTFYANAAAQNFCQMPDSLKSMQPAFSASVQERTQLINNMLNNLYATQPWYVQHNIAGQNPTLPIAGLTSAPSDVTPPPAPEEVKPEAATVAEAAAEPEAFVGDLDAFHIKVKRPNFWKVFGNFNAQVQQTQISENWYQGGNNNYSINSQFTLEANFNNKKKFTWDNKFEARAGFQTVEEYHVSTFRPTTDLLRFTSKAGLKASKHWYGALTFQSWTQMMQARDYYDSQDRRKYRVNSDFMSPFDAILSLGMDYKLEKKKFKTSVNLAPLAVSYKHVSRTGYKEELTMPEKFGLDLGKHDKFEFGSTLTATAKWVLHRNLTWDGRLYAFTSYHRTTAEFENTFTFRFNKYLSTKLFLYPRFDDGAKRVRKTDKNGNPKVKTRDGEGKPLTYCEYSYFQFKEYFSFGLDISF